MLGTRKENQLSVWCSECLTLILQLRASIDLGDSRVLRERILSLLDNMERSCRDSGIAPEDIQMVKFALVAFIDETINTSDWVQKESWLSNPLQLDLFNRLDAGEEFFTRLDQLRERPQANAEVLELYYMCMVLGFRGKYQLHEKEKLRLLIEDTHSELRRISGKPPEELSPHGRPIDEIVEVVTKEVSLWVIGVTAAAVGLFFYIVFTFLITSNAEEVRNVIKEII
jgi:type VI secretion system protein ImpK